jgi:hypothetical protein
MNLLNKKYNDKLKILEDIDKQNKMNEKNKCNNIGKNINNNINFIEYLKKETSEKFDEIYSDFILNQNLCYSHYARRNRKYHFMNNNLDKVPKNDSYLQKDAKKKNSLEKIIINVSDKRELYVINSSIDVGQRLYSYGFYLKNKLENQRRVQENILKKLMRPKIISKTQNNTTKDIIISERLYLNHKKKKNNKEKNCNSNNSNNFSYHPKINKKSLLIAQKLEPSFVRLNKNNKIKNIIEQDPQKYYLNIYEVSSLDNNTTQDINQGIFSFKNNNNNSKNKNNNKNIFEKMNNLYLRGIEERQKKQKLYNENQRKKGEEYKKFSFKPYLRYNNINSFKMNSKINYIKKKKINKLNKFKNNIYKKQFEWKKKIESKIIKKKEKKEESITKLCTFRPELSIYNYKNNNKYINKIIDQMNEYVVKRRKTIKSKISEENHKNKKLHSEVEDFSIKSTIPQEFEFETEIRNKNFNKNRSCIHLKKKSDLIGKNAEKKSISHKNNNYWFFREEINNFNHNIKDSKKENETHIKFDFFEAVSMLHNKLEHLNI